MNTSDILIEGMEDMESPEAIYKVLLAHDGKALTKRLIPLLEAAGVSHPAIRKQYGMTHIEWGKYYGWGDQQEKDNGSLLIAHSEKNVVIEADKVKEKNPAYFSAAVERNEIREKFLKTDLPDRADSAVHAFLRARQELLDILDEDDVYQVLTETRLGVKLNEYDDVYM